MRVFYIEDDARDIDLLQRHLSRQRSEIELFVANSLKDARTIMSSEDSYDAALLDLRLPDGSGLELLSEIRQRFSHMAIVVLTGSGDENAAIAALKGGADDYIAKRDNYIDLLPDTLYSAIRARQSKESMQLEPIRVLYVERNDHDVDLVLRHMARYAPHISITAVGSATEGLERLPQACDNSSAFQVVLLDYRLPGLNALGMLKVIKQERKLGIPVVLVTGQGDELVAAQALRLGAVDYLVKQSSYLLKLPTVIENAYHMWRLAREQAAIMEAYDATIAGWARALDLRDEDTQDHSRRVMELTMAMASHLNVNSQHLQHIRRGAILHDVGKMGIPDSILLKPGQLTPAEWEIMRKHPVLAYEMLAPIEYLRPALAIPYCHHEKWDGTGYPRGLKGEEIPLEARIFAVVDVYDALTSDRPYRPAWTKEKALAYIRDQSGAHFDPALVDMFFSVLNENS